MEQFAKTGDFCPNEACPDYGKLQGGQRQQNIIKFGKTEKGVQRYRCKTCKKTFTETTGTIFFRKRTPEAEMFCISSQKLHKPETFCISNSRFAAMFLLVQLE